ncbi:hypothetical protein [Sporofaciens musculi]|uniref:hypothetical protein n=1 Tax=Sporofaciens musculi TaxID=2681861 RepID=UPI0025891401|nr:hypothetical protein [Sporofaciens musculi]
MEAVSKGDIDERVQEYYDKYEILLEFRGEKEFRVHVAVQEGIEIGFFQAARIILRSFMI